MLSNFLRPRISFRQMFKKADKFDFYSTDHYSYTLKACANLNKNPNIVVAQICFNLEDYIRDLYNKKDIDFSDVLDDQNMSDSEKTCLTSLILDNVNK